jgi:hypothetical protein
MSFRELIRVVLIIVSVALTPVAWMHSRILWLVSSLLLILGAVLFYTERMTRRAIELEKHETGGSGSPVPRDIHNYSGWRTGGRSETMDHAESSDAD